MGRQRSRGVARLAELRAVVEEMGATALPGCGIKYDFILHVIWISTNDNVNADALAPLAPQALETGDFGIVEPIL